MKKKNLTAFLLLAPLALAAACSAGIQHVEIQANWYRNTALGVDIANTRETLEYDVALSESTPHNGLSAEYTNGVYTMTLTNAHIALENGAMEEGYVLETSLSVDAKFTFQGTSTSTLRDEVTTRVEFLSVRDNLRPVSSTKTAHTHVPNDAPQSAESVYTEYDYTYEVKYNDALTKATVTYTDRITNAEPNVREIEIEGNTTFLDNEQIFFAMRGMNLTSAISFRTINPTMRSVQTVGLREAAKEVTESVSFERDGQPYSDSALAAYEVRIGYGGNVGQGMRAVFAKKTSDNDNVNRNVPLRMEYAVIRSLGTMRYTLKKATFAQK